MPGSSNQSLGNAAKLVSGDFTEMDRLFAGDLRALLRKRISERKEIALMGSSSSDISDKLGKLITGTEVFFSSVVGGAVMIVASPFVTPVGGVFAGAATAVGTKILISAVVTKPLKAIPKRRIERNAKIYNNSLPEENNDIIKLFSQLVSFSMVKKRQTVQENPSVLTTVTKGLNNALDKIGRIRKISRPEEKVAIKSGVDEEFKKIWDIFKAFTRDKEEYAAFKTTPWAEKVVALFAKYCDLGDPMDRSEIVNDRDINILWINVFARYLKGKDQPGQPVSESILSSLEAKLNVIPEVSSSASLNNQGPSSFGIGSSTLPASLNESFSSFSIDSSVLPASSDEGFSSGVGSSILSASPANNASSRFFAPKVAALAANQPEPEQSLSLSTRL